MTAEFIHDRDPLRHLGDYGRNVMTYEPFEVLYRYVGSEVNLSGEMLHDYLLRNNFPQEVSDIQNCRRSPEEIRRMVTEYFDMAPLRLLGRDIQETRPLPAAKQWLEKATDLALRSAAFHGEVTCFKRHSSLSCKHSLCCPRQAALSTLIWQDTDMLNDGLVNPFFSPELLDFKVDIARRYTLIAPEHADLLREYYLS